MRTHHTSAAETPAALPQVGASYVAPWVGWTALAIAFALSLVTMLLTI